MKDTKPQSDTVSLLHQTKLEQDKFDVNSSFEDGIRQTYASWQDIVFQILNTMPNVTDENRFWTHQFFEAWNPKNNPFLTPNFNLNMLQNISHEQISQSVRRFFEDAYAGRIRLDNPDGLIVGQDIASTPGSVVHTHHLFELIQYQPTTEKVYRKPLLIVPPWINKFYIFDLSAHNSFVQWAVAQGYSVFMLSWVNPSDNTYANQGLDAYASAILEAQNYISSATQQNAMHMMGYCVGGNLLSACCARFPERVQSLTLLATILHPEHMQDLRFFLTPHFTTFMQNEAKIKGVIDGRLLSLMFQMLRPQTLLWPMVRKNYFSIQMDAEPSSATLTSDVLFWNMDSTNIPARLFQESLTRFFQPSCADEQSLVLLGEKVNLNHITCPKYVVAAQKDHIAPFLSCYPSFSGLNAESTTFVLSTSGHVAGIINPPSKEKYAFHTCSQPLPNTFDAWWKCAAKYDGSWWLHWHDWLDAIDDEMVCANQRMFSKEQLNAPGKFVHMRQIHPIWPSYISSS